jgi:hypothetical protein
MWRAVANTRRGLLRCVHGATVPVTKGLLARSTGVVYDQRRTYAAHYVIDLQDPTRGLNAVREMHDALVATGKRLTAKHLHSLVNVALSYYTMGDYRLARVCAIQAFDIVVHERGIDNYATYFAAVTAAKCSEAMLQETLAEMEMREAERLVAESTQRPRHSKNALPDVISELRGEVAQYTRVGQRIYWAPANGHLRAGTKGERSSTAWDDTDAASSTGNRKNFNARRRSETAERRRNQSAGEGPRTPR